MRSTFFGLNTAFSGISVHRRMLDTTAHNIANVATPGYSRQRVEIEAAPPFAYPGLNRPAGPGQIGTGVAPTEQVRLRDQFADNQFRAATSTLGQQEARVDLLEQIDVLVDEPGGSGLSSLLQEFWGSWQALSEQPESVAAREAVRRAGDALARGLNDMHAALERIGGAGPPDSEATVRIDAEVRRVNDLADQINSLNFEIAELVTVGLMPNDLLDKRDALVDEMAGLTDLVVSTPPGATDLRITVSVGGQAIVSGTALPGQGAGVLAVDGAGAATVDQSPFGGAVVGATIVDGRIAGLVDVRNDVVQGANGYLATLDLLALDVVTEVNAVHSAGFDLTGAAAGDFFDPAGVTAATIAMDPALTTTTIGASGAAADSPGGNANAIAIAQLQFDVHAIGGGPQITTIEGFHALWVAQVGVDTDRAARLAAVSQGVVDGAVQRRDAVAGVNLDEEVTDMIRFQQAYEAAARMMTTLDEALDVIVNRMGIVGR